MLRTDYYYFKRSEVEIEIVIRRFCTLFANSNIDGQVLLIRKFEFYMIGLMMAKDVEKLTNSKEFK
jgi:hypothetical protein